MEVTIWITVLLAAVVLAAWGLLRRAARTTQRLHQELSPLRRMMPRGDEIASLAPLRQIGLVLAAHAIEADFDSAALQHLVGDCWTEASGDDHLRAQLVPASHRRAPLANVG